MPREPQNQISHDATSLKDISEDFRGQHKGDKEELWDLFRVQLSLEMEPQRGGRVYTKTSKKAGLRGVLVSKDQDSQGANVSEAGSWVETWSYGDRMNQDTALPLTGDTTLGKSIKLT